MKVASCSQTVSPPNTSTIAPENHSIAETLPCSSREATIAATVAAMKMPVDRTMFLVSQ